jgi:hypothetical protein
LPRSMVPASRPVTWASSWASWSSRLPDRLRTPHPCFRFSLFHFVSTSRPGPITQSPPRLSWLPCRDLASVSPRRACAWMHVGDGPLFYSAMTAQSPCIHGLVAGHGGIGSFPCLSRLVARHFS